MAVAIVLAYYDTAINSYVVQSPGLILQTSQTDGNRSWVIYRNYGRQKFYDKGLWTPVVGLGFNLISLSCRVLVSSWVVTVAVKERLVLIWTYH